MNLPTDPSLINSVGSSESPRWTEFYRLYAPLVTKVARAKGLSETDAEDLTQHVMVLMTECLKTFDYKPELGKFRSWLVTVTMRAIASHWRNLYRLQRIREGITAEQALLETPKAGGEVMEGNERIQWADALIKVLVEAYFDSSPKLSEKTKLAVRLIFEERLSNAEVAKKLADTKENIAVVRSRTLEELRNIYSGLSDETLPWEEVCARLKA